MLESQRHVSLCSIIFCKSMQYLTFSFSFISCYGKSKRGPEANTLSQHLLKLVSTEDNSVEVLVIITQFCPYS